MAEPYDETWLDYLPPEAGLDFLRYGPEALEPLAPEASGALPDVSDPDLAAYTALGSSGAKRAALERQLAMAQQLQGEMGGGHSTGLGAALGGLGGIINRVNGLQQQRRAEQGLSELTATTDAARARFARGAKAWNPEQAGNLGILSGDPVLGAYGQAQQKAVQNMDAGSLRALTLRQGQRRLSLQQQEAARKAATGKEKFDLDKWKAQQQAALGWKGLGLREQEAAQQQAGNQYKVESGLRDEYYKQPAVREFPGIQGAYNQVQKAASDPNGVNDLTLIFGLMKMLDPGVSVMEGDIRNVSQTQNIPDQIYSTYLKAKNGERFAPETRQQILRTAGQVYESKRQIVDGMKSQYRSLASQTGATPERVVLPDINLMDSPGANSAGGASAPASLSGPQKTLYDFVKANPTHPRANEAREKLRRQGITPP